MDKHYEEPKYLTLCGKDYDISNVSKAREDRARDMWNKANGVGYTRQGQIKTDTKKELNSKQYEALVNKVGLSLIKQDFITIKHRMSFFDSVKEYIKRSLLTNKRLLRASRNEYQIFQDWVVFVLFGKTPEELKKKSQMELLGLQMYETMENLNLTPEQCLESFRTFAKQLAGI